MKKFVIIAAIVAMVTAVTVTGVGNYLAAKEAFALRNMAQAMEHEGMIDYQELQRVRNFVSCQHTIMRPWGALSNMTRMRWRLKKIRASWQPKQSDGMYPILSVVSTKMCDRKSRED